MHSLQVGVLRIGMHPTLLHLHILFYATAVLVACGLASWLHIINSPAARAYLAMKDGKMLDRAFDTLEEHPLLKDGHGHADKPGEHVGKCHLMEYWIRTGSAKLSAMLPCCMTMRTARAM
jgi:hypothetical protein